jgi:hypothetical protein
VEDLTRLSYGSVKRELQTKDNALTIGLLKEEWALSYQTRACYSKRKN